MITIGDLLAVSCRLRIPYVGVWVAELDVDTPTPPTGKVTITIGESKLVGTVLARGTSAFGEKSHVTIEGGGGGWSKPVGAQHFHNDAGVRLANVLSLTASQIGETIGDPSTDQLGADFARSLGPASRIFGDRTWYVDDAGITQVKDRPAAVVPVAADLIDFNGIRYCAQIASADIIRPGMAITDSKFGDLVIREVEQTFDDEGARAVAWCDRAGSTTKKKSILFEAIAAAAREGLRTPFLSSYRYRIVSQNADGRLILQIYAPTSGMPDQVAISPWPGFQGLSGELTPGALVLVEFIEGNPSLPVVRSFASGQPIALALKASATITANAPQITLNNGVQGAARMGDPVQAGPWSGTIVAGSTTTRIG